MEITTTNIYWLFIVLPNIKEIMVVVGVVGAIALIVSFLVALFTWEYEDDGWREKYKKGILILFIFSSVILSAQVFIPSKQDLVLMYGLPRALNNENVQQLPDNAVEYINTWLEQNTESLKEEK